MPGRELVNKDDPQVIEIWNLVFMQFNRKADGSLEKLAMNVIDTGMGFERLVRALQGKHSNYDTDIFQPIIREISRLSGKEYGRDEQTDVAMRVVADHLRAVAFSIADGQLPGNAKAGYVIRRILRRAVRYAYTFLGQKEALHVQAPAGVHLRDGQGLPRAGSAARAYREGDEGRGRLLPAHARQGHKPAQRCHGRAGRRTGRRSSTERRRSAFFDTYGFPLDLTELICRENGYTVDEKQFDEEMQKQKQRARNAAQTESSDWTELRQGEQQFVGYDYTEHDCRILRYRRVTQKKATFYELVLDYTPFYGEMGGQVGDTGVLVSEDETVQVIDTKRENNQSVHIVKELPKNPRPTSWLAWTPTSGLPARPTTATHLLDYALKQVLGDHVEQKGSYVSADTLRFDFSHFQKVTDEELRQAERIVNEMIRQDLPLDEHRDLPLSEAKEMGAIALFGEKYGDKVRVVRFGPSCEFCGGIHASSTGRIGLFKIISESSVAAGVRRIEAKTGRECEELMYRIEDTVKAIRSLFNNAKDLKGVIAKYIEEHDAMKKDIESFQAQAVERAKATLIEKRPRGRRGQGDYRRAAHGGRTGQGPCVQDTPGGDRGPALRHRNGGRGQAHAERDAQRRHGEGPRAERREDGARGRQADTGRWRRPAPLCHGRRKKTPTGLAQPSTRWWNWPHCKPEQEAARPASLPASYAPGRPFAPRCATN